MRDDSFDYQDRIRRIVEYAKNPSIWWNGVEYKWDKKRGKYLHWATGPNGPIAEEPPYEAMNPLFAAVGIPPTNDKKGDATPKEEPKKETPKVEEKPEEPKEEPPKEEPEPEPDSEPAPKPEREYPNGLDDVFALNEYHKPRYDSLCDALDDVVAFQNYAREEFGETFTNDELRLLKDARAAIENPDILPEFRGRLIIEAFHLAREPHLFTQKKSSPDDLKEFLKLTDDSRSFYDTLQTFKWTPWGVYLTPKTKHTSHTREEAIKDVFPYKTIPFLSKEQNVDIRAREKKLLDLAKAPTTTDAEALYILSQLGEVNSTAKSLLNGYKDYVPADGEDELFEFSKKNLFDELSKVEEKTKILRERTAAKEEPKEEPEPEPPAKEPEPNPEPEPVAEEPEPTKEPSPASQEMNVEPLSVNDLCEKLSQDLSDGEKKMIETWADSYFDPNAPSICFDENSDPQKKYVDYFKSDSVPLEAKIEAIRELQNAFKSIGDGLKDNSTSMGRLSELFWDGELLLRDIEKITKTLDKLIKKRRPSKNKKNEPVQEEEPSESQEEPQEEDDAPVELLTTDGLADKLLETPDLSVDKAKKYIDAWSHSFFNPDEPSERAFYNYFDSDSVPTYAKAELVCRLSKSIRGTRALGSYETFTGIVDELNSHNGSLLLKGVTESLSYVVNRDNRFSADWDDLAKGWKRAYDSGWFSEHENFDLFLRKSNTKKFMTRYAAVKNARTLVKLPGYLSKEDRKSILDYVGYIQNVAAMPTTTDYEAYMLVSALNNANTKMQNDRGYITNESFKKYLGEYLHPLALKEIVGRDSANAPKPPKESAPAKEEPQEEGPRKPVDLSIHAAESSEDALSIIDKVRSEIMTPEEAEKDRERHAVVVESFKNAAQYCSEHEKDRENKYNEWARSNRRVKRLQDEKGRWNFLRSLGGITQPFPEEEALQSARKQTDALADEYNAMVTERYSYTKKADAEVEEISRDRQTKMAYLKAAFPDRGGSPFFSQKWKETAINVLRARDKELASAMEEVIEVYDIIGRCYNTSGASFDPPTIKFGKTERGTGAFYRLSDNTITISNAKKNDKRTKNDIMMYVSHELGHWLELHCLGKPQARENVKYIERELGGSSLPGSDYKIAIQRDPHLTVRYDGYGLHAYEDSYFTERGEGEAISTAMEYLVAAPVLLATRSPKQFNLLLRNFEKFAKERVED